jgi:hypothetical protein
LLSAVLANSPPMFIASSMPNIWFVLEVVD